MKYFVRMSTLEVYQNHENYKAKGKGQWIFQNVTNHTVNCLKIINSYCFAVLGLKSSERLKQLNFRFYFQRLRILQFTPYLLSIFPCWEHFVKIKSDRWHSKMPSTASVTLSLFWCRLHNSKLISLIMMYDILPRSAWTARPREVHTQTKCFYYYPVY